jgi:hypothetical protein
MDFYPQDFWLLNINSIWKLMLLAADVKKYDIVIKVRT